MNGGSGRTRALSWADGLRRGPARASLTLGSIVVLVGALLSGGHQPAVSMLANAPLPAGDAPIGTDPAPAAPPVRLPDPSGRDVHAPASSSKPSHLASPPNAQGIPAVALEAYQRAAIVIDSADTSCRLDWTLLAAIGRVESDHGQFAGGHLDRNGVARPRIIGPRLDGRAGTSVVRDTDAGRLDGDRHYDHAVGPMQFLPSTWAAVAVDGDADGRRNVQDIDDAALGSAVYLCADHGDLGTRAGQRAALLRYNHSQSYAAEVLAIAHDYASSAGQLPSSGVDVRQVSLTHTGQAQHRPRHHARHHHGPRHHHPGPNPPGTPTGGPTPTPPTGPGGGPGTPGGPSDPPTTGNPGFPGNPDEPAVLPDPLPTELADLTDAQVQAYDAAWATCDDDLTAGWSAAPYVVATLTQCLAEQVDVAVDDPDLVAFVGWLAETQDPDATDPTVPAEPTSSADPSAPATPEATSGAAPQ